MSHGGHFSHNENATPEVHGVLAEYDNVSSLMHACEQVKKAGYCYWDAHTPFAVHGLDKAMGIKPTRLPWIVLGMALIGLASGVLLQWWTNAVDYPFPISGKPVWSLPANIPVAFEFTVLFSALTVFFGVLGINKLPELFNPLFKNEKFARATNDRFFIYIEAKDPLFQGHKASDLLSATRPLSLETLYWSEKHSSYAWPKGTSYIAMIVVALSLLPLAMFARAREYISEKPRIHVIPDDMDNQYKFKPQSSNWFFDDGRAMRQPVEGTVEVSQAIEPTPYLTGKDGEHFIAAFPKELSIHENNIKRGQQRFNVYCTPCHGVSGYGNGSVAQRAEKLKQGTWVQPSSLHDQRLRDQAVGELFNTISHGIRSMPAYGHLIDVEDRWLIALYVKALQLSQHASASDISQDILQTLP